MHPRLGCPQPFRDGAAPAGFFAARSSAGIATAPPPDAAKPAIAANKVVKARTKTNENIEYRLQI